MAEITITIKRRKKKQKVFTEQTTGSPIWPKKRRKALKRRLSGGEINFWDLGQYWNGSAWKDIPFSYLDLDLNLGVSEDIIGPLRQVSGQLPHSASYDLRDALLAEPFENWKTYYRKIEYEPGERYGIAILNPDGTFTQGIDVFPVGRDGAPWIFQSIPGDPPIENSKWTSTGLKVSNLSNKFTVATGTAFEQFGNSDDVKITIGPDFDNTEVTDFVLAKKADVYLVPSVISHIIKSRDDASYFQHHTLGSYRTFAREFWLNRTDTENDGRPFLLPGFFGEKIDSTTIADLVTYVTSDPLAQAFTLVDGPASNQVTLGTASFDTDAHFDAYYANTSITDLYFGTFSGYAVMRLFQRNSSETSNIGALLGVIAQNGNVYYFWDKTGNNMAPGQRLIGPG